jgi:hypothetical protein
VQANRKVGYVSRMRGKTSDQAAQQCDSGVYRAIHMFHMNPPTSDLLSTVPTAEIRLSSNSGKAQAAASPSKDLPSAFGVWRRQSTEHMQREGLIKSFRSRSSPFTLINPPVVAPKSPQNNQDR